MTDHPLPMIIAHRGASADAPENTLAAFRLGLEQGADGIEGDFRLTVDGHIVCLHDASTRRTGDIDLTAAKSSLAELRQVDLGLWKGAKWKAERITTLPEVIAILPEKKLFFLEVKCGPEIVPPLKQILKDWPGAKQQLTVIAFDPRVIRAMRKELPEIQANWLTEFKHNETENAWHPTGEEVAEVLADLETNGVGVQANPVAVNQAFTKPLDARHVDLHVWTVDDAALARHFISLGFKSLTTNRPGELREKLQGDLSEFKKPF